jgi:hypothetical protein
MTVELKSNLCYITHGELVHAAGRIPKQAHNTILQPLDILGFPVDVPKREIEPDALVIAGRPTVALV